MNKFKGLHPYLIAPDGENGLAVLVLIFLSALASLIPAFLQRVLFDRVIPDRSLYLVLPVLLTIVIVEAAGTYARFQADRHLAGISKRCRTLMRRGLSRLLWPAAPNWLGSLGTGGILRHYEDAAVLGDLRSIYLGKVIGSCIILLVLLPPMLVLHPLLTACRIAAAVPAVFAGRFFLADDLKMESRLWAERRTLASSLSRAVRGAASLQVSSGEEGFVRYLQGCFRSLGRGEEERQLLMGAWERVSTFSAHIGSASVLALAVFLVIRGGLSFGAYIAFSIIASRFLSALGELLAGVRSMARAGNAAIRHQGLLDGAGPGRLAAKYLGTGNGKANGLRIRGLNFAYPCAHGPGVPVLNAVNLEVSEGEWVHLKGGSGAGKSTLLSLLLGFSQPLSGQLEWRGLSLSDCPPQIRRTLVGAVLQEPVFFDATVRENLCLYETAPSDRRLWQALEASEAAEIVSRLPGGLDARLSGEESGLSGGERQRLSIARLLVHSPPLVLLDEPLNALDPSSARRVAESLARVCSGRAVILVSHMETSALAVHRTVVLEQGRIRGTEGCVYG